METVVLNNEMQLSYPDGFHVMSEEELSKMTFYGEAPGWCISDPERHIDLSVSWKKTNGLFAKILNKIVVSIVDEMLYVFPCFLCHASFLIIGQ